MIRNLQGVVGQFTPSLFLDFTKGVMPSGLTFTRNSIATRVNSSGLIETVPANVPRFTYDPVTLACLGVMREENRTNMFTYSQQIDSNNWAKLNGLLEVSSLTNVGAGITVWKLTNNTGSVNWTRARQTPIVVAGTTYTASCIFQPGSTNYAAIVVSEGGNYNAIFNLTGSGSIAITSAGITARIRYLGDNRYLCEATYTATTTSLSVNFGPGGTAFASSNPSDSVYMTCMQFEPGAFATSRIPTTNTAVPRNADIITRTIDAWYNQAEGTVVCTYRRVADQSVTGELYRFSDGTTNNTIQQYAIIAGTQARQAVVVGGVQQFQFTGVLANTGRTKVALALRAGNFAGCSSANSNLSTSASGAMPTGLTTLNFDGNNIIESLTYYPRRMANSFIQQQVIL